ncbi:NAD-dependent DNA ligase LigA [Rhizosphaericola mali]|uniref:DNA ligase n=1 Tax=Rhizosphaericola mali TaxID=2545455 RepID=A0A5P2FX42_9BACT|nr:NAD-dependent DNA ligase LigA [Rhizosphaericola mali]QES87755.1 DNA ligase (NAD(+)) LigA [Rhizosphaericola mali]
MYVEQQVKELQKDTLELLANTAHLDVDKLPLLRAVLHFHENRYYVLDNPLISDTEYDMLYKALERIEKEHPELITPDSPTQRVGKELSGDFQTVDHLVPMLSLSNSYNAEDLKDWDERVREKNVSELKYCVEPKFDGAGISLIYENDYLVRGATRGDGVQGDDITTNIKQIKSIPLSAPFSKYGIQQIEIRGEVLMFKESFKKYNQSLAEQGQAILANPRNAASGTIRMKDPAIVGKRNLSAYLYYVSDYTLIDENVPLDEHLKSQSGCLQMLWDCGFLSPVKQIQVYSSIEDVVKHVHDFEEMRDTLPFEIDGMVIKVDNIETQEFLGSTSHHPRWAMAFKFKARQATSHLREVIFQVGRTGAITPVAKIDPVAIGGVTVSSVSLFNEDIIKEKDLKINDTVLVERAADVIPYIVKSQAELRDGTETEIVFPTHCPVCNSELIKPEGESVWRCVNPNCEAQVLEKIIHFGSKDAMDIRNLGDALVRKFFSLGLLKDIPGIYSLDYEAIGNLPGFGKRSVENLQTAIEASKSQTLNRLIYALGIRYVGETTAKTLANKITNLWDLKNYSSEELMALEDIGPKVAKGIQDFFAIPESIEMLTRLEAVGVSFANQKKSGVAEGEDVLHGQSFLFTGSLTKFKRSEAETLVESRGGKILSGVSSKLNYLVVGEDAGSKLEKAKKLNTVKILSEDEFLAMTQL